MKVTAKLNKLRISSRKAMLVANIIRGQKVNKALDLLKHDPRKVSNPMKKLVLSCLSNWQNVNPKSSIDENTLVVSEVRVDQGGMIKRIKPAAQGRAHRIRKRSSHITLSIENLPTKNDTPANSKDTKTAQVAEPKKNDTVKETKPKVNATEKTEVAKKSSEKTEVENPKAKEETKNKPKE